MTSDYRNALRPRSERPTFGIGLKLLPASALQFRVGGGRGEVTPGVVGVGGKDALGCPAERRRRGRRRCKGIEVQQGVGAALVGRGGDGRTRRGEGGRAGGRRKDQASDRSGKKRRMLSEVATRSRVSSLLPRRRLVFFRGMIHIQTHANRLALLEGEVEFRLGGRFPLGRAVGLLAESLLFLDLKWNRGGGWGCMALHGVAMSQSNPTAILLTCLK